MAVLVLWLPSLLLSIDQYQSALLVDRGIYLNNLPTVVTWQQHGWEWLVEPATFESQVQCSNRYTIRLRGVMHPWFNFWFWCYIYIVCFPNYPFFFTFFLLTFSLTYSFPLRIDPLRFRVGCRKRRLNLALVFLCLFCCNTFFDWWMRAFVVLGLVFSYTKPSDWLAETSVKWPILCRVGRKITTQSINQHHQATRATCVL